MPDFSYLLGAKPVDIPDPLQQAAKMMQVQNLASTGKLSQLNLQKAQQDQESQQAFQQALPGLDLTDKNAVMAAMQANPQAAQAILKAAQDAAKNNATVGKDQAETDAKKAETSIKLLGAVGSRAAMMAQNPNVDPRDAKALYDSAISVGIPTSLVGQPNNPQDPESWRQWLGGLAASTYSAADQARNKLTAQQQQETGRHNVATEGNDAATLQENARYHNQVDSRARDLRADSLAAQGKPQVVTDANGNMFAVDPRTASGKPIVGDDGQPLNKGAKPLTEVQGNAAAFGARMQQANGDIDKLSSSGMSLTNPTNLLAGNAWTNPVASADAQAYEQAKNNFMTAALRKESGASISKSEYDVFDKTYFPQVGDKAQTVAQKAALRQQAIQNMRTQAGPSGTQAIDSAGVPAKPRLGEVRQGYLFKGGDPADQKSWEKVSG